MPSSSRKKVLTIVGVLLAAQIGIGVAMKLRAKPTSGESSSELSEAPQSRDPRREVEPTPTAATTPPIVALPSERHVAPREPAPTRAPARPPTPHVPHATVTSTTRAVFDVEPRSAALLLDGVPLGNVPAAGIEIKPGPHQLVVNAAGFEPGSLTFDAIAGRTTAVRLSLVAKAPTAQASPLAVPSLSPVAVTPPAAKPSPAAPPTPTGEPTPRVSATGSPTAGKALFGARCSACHALTPGMYSRAQWASFLGTGRHDRFARLGGKVTVSELASIAAYLDENAADAAKDQGAGIR